MPSEYSESNLYNQLVFECASMISNSFTLNSSSKPKPERPQLNRMNALMPTALCLNNNNNNNNNNSPKKSDNMVIDEYTFFGAHSPNGSSRAGSLSPPGSISPNELSPTRCDIQHKQLNALHIKRSFDETDTTSTDSGYGTYDINNTVKQYSFKFTQPNGFAPRRATPSPPKVMCQHPHINHMSPMKPNESPKQKLPQLISDCSQSFNYDSSDEDYNLFDMDAFDEETQLPTDFNSLLSGHIKSQRQTTPKNKEFVRRCLSMTDSNVIKTPKSCLFGGSMGTPEVCNSPKSTDSLTPIRAFKRPEPPTISPILSKRYKYETEKEDQENQMEIEMLNNVGTAAIARPAFRKSVSMNDAVIRSALARSSSDPDLIGDFSKKFCLPMVSGKHADLKSITNDTMARLVRGEYSDNVATYKIIDCRYPYEYEGGHIRGAQNLFTCDQIVDELVNIKTDNASVDMAETNGKRHILVFHCEFSSERGPKLSRFLRKLDRERNTHSYPALHYPEVYLLHGGYKDFYGNFPELCDPISYRPMDDPSYSEAYRLFRAKTRSWSGDTKSSGTASRFIRRDDRSRSRLIL